MTLLLSCPAECWQGMKEYRQIFPLPWLENGNPSRQHSFHSSFLAYVIYNVEFQIIQNMSLINYDTKMIPPLITAGLKWSHKAYFNRTS